MQVASRVLREEVIKEDSSCSGAKEVVIGSADIAAVRLFRRTGDEIFLIVKLLCETIKLLPSSDSFQNDIDSFHMCWSSKQHREIN